jgi:hypothetical protein
MRRSGADVARRAAGRTGRRNNEVAKAQPESAKQPEQGFPGWERVRDPQTGRFYYWHRASNLTTHLDEQPPTPSSAASSIGSALAQSAAVGAGMAFAFGLVRVILG